MDLYFASTPFNLLNCIMIHDNNRKSADLLITDFSPFAYGAYCEIKKTDLFENVFFIAQKQFETTEHHDKNIFVKIARKLRTRFNNRLRYKAMKKRFFPELPCKKYDLFYFDSPNYVQRLLFNYYYSINKKLRCVRVDCGIESYYSLKQVAIPFKSLRDPTKSIMKRCDAFYLCEPKAVIDKTIETVRINYNYNLLNTVNQIFDYSENDTLLLEKKIIYFDQLLDNSEWNTRQMDFIEYLRNHFDFTVKLHPRRTQNYYGCESFKTSSAFELILLNGKSLFQENSIYITPMSTAVFLPKMLLNKEPYVICLLELFQLEWTEKEAVLDFITYMKKLYRDPSKIVVPKNNADLTAILNAWLR